MEHVEVLSCNSLNLHFREKSVVKVKYTTKKAHSFCSVTGLIDAYRNCAFQTLVLEYKNCITFSEPGTYIFWVEHLLRLS